MNRHRYCEQCGSELYEGMKFCGNCGARIVQRQEPQNEQTPQMDRSEQNAQSGRTARSPRNEQPSQNMQPRRNTQPQQKEHPLQAARPTLNMQPRHRDPNAYESRNQRRPGAPYDERMVYQEQQAAQRQNRYRQEELEKDWQQSWEREDSEEEESGFTPVQYVLIGIAIILLMALVGFGVYWILGRSTGNTARRQNQNNTAAQTLQTDSLEAETLADIMILDDTQDKETEPKAQTEAEQSEKSSMSEPKTAQTEQQTEVKPVQTETEPVQTEKQTETEPKPAIEIIDGNQTAEQNYDSGYIPESSSRIITDSDVAGMSYDDLQMAINEIYARHGRIFRSENIAQYFNSQSWYNGTLTAENFDESVFSSVESQNIQFLLEKMDGQ